MVRDTFEQSHLDQVKLDDGTLIHLVRNPLLEQLLFDRTIIGAEFEDLCSRSSRLFLGHLTPTLTCSKSSVAELIILSKGVYYDLRRQFRDLFDRGLEMNLIATKRESVQGSDVSVMVTYYDYVAEASTIIIGDTVASGSTISAAIRHYSSQVSVQHVIVVSFAGSGRGAKEIRRACLDLGIEVSFFFALAAFGLGDNGFDLSFLHPDTITEPEYVERARQQFNGQPVSCVGWDFGAQAQAIKKYRALCWAESIYWGLQGSEQFRLSERPEDISILSREAAAFGGLAALE